MKKLILFLFIASVIEIHPLAAQPLKEQIDQLQIEHSTKTERFHEMMEKMKQMNKKPHLDSDEQNAFNTLEANAKGVLGELNQIKLKIDELTKLLQSPSAALNDPVTQGPPCTVSGPAKSWFDEIFEAAEENMGKHVSTIMGRADHLSILRDGYFPYSQFLNPVWQQNSIANTYPPFQVDGSVVKTSSGLTIIPMPLPMTTQLLAKRGPDYNPQQDPSNFYDGPHGFKPFLRSLAQHKPIKIINLAQDDDVILISDNLTKTGQGNYYLEDKEDFQVTGNKDHVKTIVYKDKDTPHPVTMHHFANWPDFGVPDATRAKEIAKLVHEMDDQTIINCRGGFGRTGTLILARMLVDKFPRKEMLGNYQEDFSARKKIYDVLMQLRIQRLGSVQKPEQLKFALAIYEQYLQDYPSD